MSIAFWRCSADLDRLCLLWGWSIGWALVVLSLAPWLLAAGCVIYFVPASIYIRSCWSWASCLSSSQDLPTLPRSVLCAWLQVRPDPARILVSGLGRSPRASVSLLHSQAGKPRAPGRPGSVPGVRVPRLPSLLSVPTAVPVCCSYFSDGFICPHLHKKYHAPHPNEQAHLAVPASSPLRAVWARRC